MAKILLIGDTNNLPNEGYHVGDEAMLYMVKDRIAKELPQCTTTTFQPAMPELSILADWLLEIQHHGNVPPAVKLELEKCDVIWIVGAGNLNSIFKNYLYHRIVLIFSAYILRKLIVVTGQTIGPCDPADSQLLNAALTKCNYISIRDNLYSATELRNSGQNFEVQFDDAYDLPSYRINLQGEFQVGLSLRDWDKPDTVNCVNKILSLLDRNYKLHLIPQMIDKYNSMDSTILVNNFDGIAYNFDYFRNQEDRIEVQVKSLTRSVDLMITTRYHGAIFAVSEDVKCVALYQDDYYMRKMLGLLSLGVDNLLVVNQNQALDSRKVREFLSLNITHSNKRSLTISPRIITQINALR